MHHFFHQPNEFWQVRINFKEIGMLVNMTDQNLRICIMPILKFAENISSNSRIEQLILSFNFL